MCAGHVLPLVYYSWEGYARQAVYFIVFRFVGNYIQTSADDVIISQLWVISQLFSSYRPSEAFCQVSKLTIQREHGRL